MPQASLSANRWRMLRLALKKKRSHFTDLRNMQRRDQADADWLVANGLLAAVGEDFYELTAAGRESADLGFYEWTLPPRSTAKPAAKKRAKV